MTPGKVYEVLGAGAAAGGSLAGADAAAAALDVSADQAKPLPRMPLPRMPSLAAAGFNADEAAMRWSVDAGGESWWTVPSPRKRKQASLDVFELVVVGAGTTCHRQPSQLGTAGLWPASPHRPPPATSSACRGSEGRSDIADHQVRHRLCLVCSTAFAAKTLPFLAVLQLLPLGDASQRRH